MSNKRDCCDRNMVRVNKYSDLEVPEVDQKGNVTGDYGYVNIDLFVCKFCGEVEARITDEY